MNRREMLAAIGVSGLLTSSTLAETTKKADLYLELRVAGKPEELAFTVEEFGAGGKSLGLVRSEDERGLALFLTRTFKDPSGPKQLRFIIANGAMLEKVWGGVKASQAGGFTEISLYGNIPPGCGIRAGAMPNHTRHHGTVYRLDKLKMIVEDNLGKC